MIRRALSFLKPDWWMLRVAAVAFWIWSAVDAYQKRELVLLMLSCFMLGCAFSNELALLRERRLERLRAAFDRSLQIKKRLIHLHEDGEMGQRRKGGVH